MLEEFLDCLEEMKIQFKDTPIEITETETDDYIRVKFVYDNRAITKTFDKYTISQLAGYKYLNRILGELYDCIDAVRW